MVQSGQADEGAEHEPLTRCAHGDAEKTHADVGAWMRQRAEVLREKKWLEMGPAALSPEYADIRADGGKRFPGCAQVSPLLVLLLAALPAQP